jgi:hypothetical protein
MKNENTTQIKDKSLAEELGELLNQCGLIPTFDPYRDNTKGCGKHCRGWALSTSTEFCSNHKDAILRGDYIIPGSYVDRVISFLKEQNGISTTALAEIVKGDYLASEGLAETAQKTLEANRKKFLTQV